MIRNAVVMALIICICAGCSTAKPQLIAYHCPRLQLPPDPPFYAARLTSKSPPDEVVKAWVATAVGYHDWNRIVRSQVESSI